ncbi:hypothetical protein MKX78_12485 [Cytobacillus sp. FSL R5-0569]|uniref:hypothetical protein n=1 Tax=Cytobacillus TaxID=2675230 RepID=UPI002782DF34|nr:hypothetical protein [Cytobacillus kochii]MDQ0184413.1 hypothetical protein [Cytobacillus kochii]
MRKIHGLLITIFFLVYFATFLPNFGFFNELDFVLFLPQPLAWVLFLNAINTGIIFIIYFYFFKPFAKRVMDEIDKEE